MTPSVSRASASARSCSATEPTVPPSVTVDPSVDTSIDRALMESSRAIFALIFVVIVASRAVSVTFSAAMAALSLVQAGILGLDENVNLQLKSWQVPDNEFTTKDHVTLRRLVSHTAGMTVPSFHG